MKIYLHDENGYFIGERDARLCPASALRGITKYLIPRNATTIEPPAVQEGYCRKFQENQWIQEEIIADSFTIVIEKEFDSIAITREIEAAGLIVNGIENNTVSINARETTENKALTQSIIDAHDKAEVLKQNRIAEIKARLIVLDEKAVRPLRAITTGVGTDEDNTFLVEIENEAQVLRSELATLEA